MTIPAAQPQKREVKPAGSYTGQAPVSSFAAPSGLLFNKITVIQSRDTVQSNQPLARKSPQCQEHKSPSPRRALHSCSTWGPLMPLTALRNSSAGATLLQAPSAATSTLPLVPLGLLRVSFLSQKKPEWIFCTAPEPVPGAAGGAGNSFLAGFEDSHGAEFLSSASKPCNFASLCSNEAE